MAVEATGTVRGGEKVKLWSQPPSQTRDATRDESFTTSVLPSSWTSSLVSDAKVTPTPQGLVVRSGGIPGAQADLITVAYDYLHFDAAVDVLFADPKKTPGPTTPGRFRLYINGTNYLQVRAAFDSTRRGTDGLIVIGEYALEGFTGGQRTILGRRRDFTLRIVRSGKRAWLFAGRRPDLDKKELYEDLVQLVYTDQLPENAPGQLQIRVSNDGTDANLNVRVRNFTVHSHARIENQLLVDKTTRFFNRVEGLVPKTDLEDVGTKDISLFGLFGVSTKEDAFEYTTPTARRIINDTGGDVRSYQDPQLRDGD